MMMKKILIAFAMIAMLASCAKETVTPEPPVMADPLMIHNKVFLVVAGDMLTPGELLMFRDSTMTYKGVAYSYVPEGLVGPTYFTNYLVCESFVVSAVVTGSFVPEHRLRLSACDGTSADIVPAP